MAGEIIKPIQEITQEIILYQNNSQRNGGIISETKTTQHTVKFFNWRSEFQQKTVVETKRFLVEHCNFPRLALLGNWNRNEILKTVWDFIIQEYLEISSRQRRGLYIHGTKKIRKTTLLGLIAVELELRFFISPKYVSSSEYINKYAHFQNEEVEKYKNVPMLMLDDLGKEYIGNSEFRMSGLYELLKHRYQYMLPTFITSHLRPEEIAKRGKTNFAYSEIFDFIQEQKLYGIFNYGHKAT